MGRDDRASAGGKEILVVLCHPRATSFSHAIADRCARTVETEGLRPLVHDLYREGFDPVARAEELDRGFSFDEQVQRFGAELSRARGLIVVHPDWWGQPPALLKGWVDRVFRPGVAYDIAGGDGAPTATVPLLTGKRALVFATTDDLSIPATLEAVWRTGVFAFCGIPDAEVRVFTDTRGSTHGRRERWLAEVEEVVRATFAAGGRP
jgi:NAD(P)H dehydrogenase (quinone)